MKIIQETATKREDITITEIKVLLPISLSSSKAHLGADPGTTNLGVATIYPQNVFATIYNIKMQRNANPIERMQNIQDILTEVVRFYEPETVAVIEGASYGAVYRQVELAEARAAIALWCVKYGIDVKILPPKTIRKQVLGNGNLKAPDVWGLKKYPNAADALACAYASVGL